MAFLGLFFQSKIFFWFLIGIMAIILQFSQRFILSRLTYPFQGKEFVGQASMTQGEVDRKLSQDTLWGPVEFFPQIYNGDTLRTATSSRVVIRLDQEKFQGSEITLEQNG